MEFPNTMSDPKAIERANSYRDMMRSWAWKDFEEIMKSERQSALEAAIVSSDIKDVQEKRGFVRCIDSLFSELETVLRAQ
jgi:hypothetical protein